MRLSDTGRNFIQAREGSRLTAYKDGGGVWTIGYGHTGPDVHQGLKITRLRAIELFDEDAKKFEDGVNDLVGVPLTQGQFDALVSFAYNVGLKAFAESTMLRRLNITDYWGAHDQFLRWVKDNGKTIPGLVRRREAEQLLFWS